MSVMAWSVSLPALIFLLLALGVLERLWRRKPATDQQQPPPVAGVDYPSLTDRDEPH